MGGGGGGGVADSPKAKRNDTAHRKSQIGPE